MHIILNERILVSYADVFLLFCFQNFNTVSIWSDSLKHPQAIRYEYEELLEKVSASFGEQCQFYYVLTGKDCTYENGIVTKSLFTIQRTNSAFNAYNTIIVDITPNAFICNRTNGIYLPSCSGISLLILREYLQHLISGSKIFGNIVHLNTPQWYLNSMWVYLAEHAAKQYVPLADMMEIEY